MSLPVCVHCLALSCVPVAVFVGAQNFISFYILFFFRSAYECLVFAKPAVCCRCVGLLLCLRMHAYARVNVSVLKSPFDFTQRTHWRRRRLRLLRGCCCSLRLLLLHHHFLTLALSFPLLSFPLYICAAIVAAAYVHEQMQATIRWFQYICLYISTWTRSVLARVVSFSSISSFFTLCNCVGCAVCVGCAHVRWTTRMPTTNINIAYTTENIENLSIMKQRMATKTERNPWMRAGRRTLIHPIAH